MRREKRGGHPADREMPPTPHLAAYTLCMTYAACALLFGRDLAEVYFVPGSDGCAFTTTAAMLLATAYAWTVLLPNVVEVQRVLWAGFFLVALKYVHVVAPPFAWLNLLCSASVLCAFAFE